MNKIFSNSITLYFFVLVMFLASCDEGGEETDPIVNPPTVSVGITVASTGEAFNSGGSIAATDTLVFSDFTLKTPGGFNVFRSKSGVDPAIEISRTTLGVDAGTTEVTIAGFKVAIPEASANSTLNFAFEVVDDLNQVTDIAYDVVVTEKPSPNARKVSTRMLAAPSGDDNSKTFYSIDKDLLYSRNDVENTADPISPDIDLGYYYGASNNASLAAPAAYPSGIYDLVAAGWGTRHETTLKLTTLTSADFDNFTSIADVEVAFDLIDLTEKTMEVTQLSVGDVVVFETDVDKTPVIRGFIRVAAINGTSGTNDNIEIDLVLNQEEQID